MYLIFLLCLLYKVTKIQINFIALYCIVLMYFLKTLQVLAPCHRDVLNSFLVLMECCLNFLNIEKNKICKFLFSIFHVFFAFYALSNIKIMIKY